MGTAACQTLQEGDPLNYNDVFVWGTTRIGADGRLLNHGTSNLKGAVTNHGLMALMNIALFQSDYSAEQAELRLPAVVNNYDGTSTGPDIPLLIEGASRGTSTVYTVDPADWQTLQTPRLGDNYILSLRDGDAPAQDVFLLGNDAAKQVGLYLKRVDDADGTADYYMWQVAGRIKMTFDKNGGDTEADPREAVQDYVA